jgi:hypothetical protein
MSDSYRVAPLFLIRMAGVPFESLSQLATEKSAAAARELLVRQERLATARNAAERFVSSRASGLSAEESRAFRATLRDPRTAAGAAVDAAVLNEFVERAAAADAADVRLREELEAEIETARRALLSASRTYLPDYLIFGGGAFGERVNDFFATRDERGSDLPQRNAKTRERERHLLLYLQRVGAKNDTFSKFGPSAWGRITAADKELQLSCAEEIAARDVFLERWTAHAVAAAINADPAVRELVETGEAQPVIVRALEPHAFDVLVSDVEAWPESEVRSGWLDALKPIAETPARFAAAETISARLEVMNDARERLRELGATAGATQRFLYAATNPIAEECARDCDFQLGRGIADELARDAAPWIDLWRDTYAFVASRVAAGLRTFLETAPMTDGVVSLSAFLQHCQAQRMPLTGPGLVALAHIAFQEVKAAFRQTVNGRPDSAEWELSAEDCHFVRRQFQYPKFDEYTFPSADLQLSATSVEAVNAGDYQWILAELHPPVAMLHHALIWNCPDTGAVADALRASVFGKPSFHFGFAAADFTGHTTVRQMDITPDLVTFVAPQRAKETWRVVQPSDAEVFVDETGDVGVRVRSSREYLGSFARAWVVPLGFHPFFFGRAPHLPRLRCGNVIVQRQSWTVTLEELPAGNYTGVSRNLVTAIERLRVTKGWPRYIYIRPSEQALRRSGAEGRDKDTKPVFIDLESYLFLEIFHGWLTKAGELEVTEMLPDPDHLLWREKDGRRTFELRTLIVPAE